MVEQTETAGLSSRLVDREAVAQALGVSTRKLQRMESELLVPAPLRIGRNVRWPADEIDAWSASRCPPREQWERLQTAAKSATRN
jgi:predicted DNA-binding transcriptional regulator AlpA